MNLINVYINSINTENEENEIIWGDPYSDKPNLHSGIISPESTINVGGYQDAFLKLNSDGMKKIIQIFEDKWQAIPEEKRKLGELLEEIYETTEEFLGARDSGDRYSMYTHSSDSCLNLSEIEGKGIGKCAERAAIAHQLLSILEKAGIISFKSYFTISRLHDKSQISNNYYRNWYHVFIIIENNNNTSKFIFDIENPLTYSISDDPTEGSRQGIALYPITEEQIEALKNGKTIFPLSVYERNGLSLRSGHILGFGQNSVQAETEKDGNAIGN